jgi:hypothetical protein
MQGPAAARDGSHGSSEGDGGSPCVATAHQLLPVASETVPSNPTASDIPQQALPRRRGSEFEFGAFDDAQASSSRSGSEFGAFDDAALPAEAPQLAATASNKTDLLALPHATFQTAAAALLSWLLPPGQQSGAALQASSGSSLPALHSTDHATTAGLPTFGALASRFPQFAALAAAAGPTAPSSPSWHGSCVGMVGPGRLLLHMQHPTIAPPV